MRAAPPARCRRPGRTAARWPPAASRRERVADRARRRAAVRTAPPGARASASRPGHRPSPAQRGSNLKRCRCSNRPGCTTSIVPCISMYLLQAGARHLDSSEWCRAAADQADQDSARHHAAEYRRAGDSRHAADARPGRRRALSARRWSPGTTAQHEGDMLDFARAHGVEPVLLPALGPRDQPARRPGVAGAHGAAGPTPEAGRGAHAHGQGRHRRPTRRAHVRRAADRAHLPRPRLSQLLQPGQDARLPDHRARARPGDQPHHRHRRRPARRDRQLRRRAAGTNRSRFGWASSSASSWTPSASEASCAASWASRADVPLVGIVARLVPIKAHEVFLQAARRVLGELPRAQFLIVGDGERRQELEALTDQLGLSRQRAISRLAARHGPRLRRPGRGRADVAQRGLAGRR